MSISETFVRLPARGGPHLVGRFMLVTVTGLTLAGVGIAIVVDHALARQSQRQAVARAQAFADAVLDRRLRATDLRPGLPAARRHELAVLVAPSRLGPDSLGATLFSGSRIVVSTAPPGLPNVGASRVASARAGNTISFVDHGRHGPVLRTLLPLRLGETGNGVLELDQDYRVIAGPARHNAWIVAAILEGLLAGLCLLLLPMLAGAARRLRRHVTVLDHLASHDELTGLLNRAGFYRSLEEMLATGSRGAVVLVDIDAFHEINDTIGSEHGDRILSAVAGRLATLHRVSRPARLGEDEFALLCDGLDEPGLPDFLHALDEALAEPFETNGIQLAIAVSTGTAFYPAHGGDSHSLLRHASTALSHARDDRLPTAVYTPEQERRDVSRLSFAAELRHAGRSDQLVVHYQPQVTLASGRITAVEALIRWQHPTRGLLSAAKFIEAAERSGLTGEIGRYVLATSSSQWRCWRDLGIDLDIAVNLSTVDLLDLSLPGTITALLIEHEMPADRLVVEITERTLLHGEYQSSKVLQQLDRIGVRLSIDDYGTGYSSLAVLRRLPIRQVKIDKSFVDGLPNDRDNDQIVRSTVQLAHTLGAATVAEGVETTQQLAHLTALGCDAAQGYLVGRPCEADEITSLLLGANRPESRLPPVSPTLPLPV